jgi:hypothetical protein
MCLFKERHGNLASNNAQVGSIRRLEELVEDALFLGGQIQVRVSLCYSIYHSQSPSIPYTSCGLYKKRQDARRGGSRMMGSGAPGGPPELRGSSQKTIASFLNIQNQ